MKERRTIRCGNVWKKVAICGLIVFSIIILLSAVRIIKFKSKFSPLLDVSEEQKEKALFLLEEISNKEGYLLENYDIKIDDRIRGINVENKKKHVLRVDLESENEAISYLIDTDDWIVVQSSQIKYNGWMLGTTKRFSQHKPLPPPKRGRWFHNELMMEEDRRAR
ncbi:MAG: hypothetical protein Q8O03_09070 [Nanoarchaeota archaeon]|nr:hypothetical protein [Nanoarchaeota archaeon]